MLTGREDSVTAVLNNGDNNVPLKGDDG